MARRAVDTIKICFYIAKEGGCASEDAAALCSSDEGRRKMMKDLIRGAIDLHIHTSPDVVKRKCDDLELAERLLAAGMGGCLIKNHYLDTAARAKLVQKLYPQLRIEGGIALNRSAGGLNPYAIERSAQAGGHFMWFPTLEARAYFAITHKDSAPEEQEKFIPVCGADGELLPEAEEVLDACEAHKMIVGTGHISAKEGMKVVEGAIRRGLQPVLTHCDNPNDCYTIEEQKKAAGMGAVIEHSYFTVYHNRVMIEEIAEQIRAVGCEHVILDTDAGQLNSPYSDEGLAEFAEKLMGVGFTEAEIRRMICDNPRKLLDGEKLS